MPTISVTGNYSVGPSDYPSFSEGAPAYTLDGQYASAHGLADPTLTDQGTIDVSSSTNNVSLTGIADTVGGAYANAAIDITAYATFMVEAFGAGTSAYGYASAGAAGAALENDGVFAISAVDTAFGLQLASAARLQNTGFFVVSANAATGVSAAGGTIDNSGTISVSGIDATAIALDASAGGSISNSGDLTVFASSGGQAVGISVTGHYSASQPLVIDNGGAGTIQAVVAIQESDSVSPGETPVLHLTNEGIIEGDIDLGQGPSSAVYGVGQVAGSQIHNSGTINGAIHLDLNGNDLYDGSQGSQTGGVYLGNGTDTVLLGNGGETAFGGAGASSITGGTGADTIVGGAGNETIDGGGGNDSLDGGGGVNTLSFASAATGVAFDLSLQGQAQATGVGSVTANHFQNLTGSAYNDVLSGNAGDNVIDGGAGVNTISYASATAGVTVSLALQGQAQNTVGAGHDTLIHFQNIIGSAYNDTLSGDGNNNVLTGGLGADTFVLPSGGGSDIITDFTAAQGDRIDLTAFQSFHTLSDVLAASTQSGADTVIAWSGGQVTLQNVSVGSLVSGDFIFPATFYSTAGNDVLDGGSPPGTISYALAPAAVTVSLALQGAPQDTIGAGVDTLTNFANIIGSAFNDTLAGDGGNNILDGGPGVNTVSYAAAAAGVTVDLTLQGEAQNTGGAGIDTLNHFQNVIGSAFNDTLGGDGDDNVLDGGAGINTVSYAGAAAGVTVSLALQGSAQDTLGAGHDTLSNFQNLTGSAFNDTLSGDGHDNVLDGGAGVNTVSYASATAGVTVSLALQGQAQDTVGAGHDTLSHFQNLTGSAYNDTLAGDADDNVLDGGGGINTVSYAAAGAGVTVDLSLQGQAQNTVGAGTDTLSHFQNLTGSAYNDVLAGDGNDNVLDGGAGTNTVSYAHAAGGVTVSLALQGQAQDTVGAGHDTLSNFRNLTGSAYGDTLTGDANDNVIDGGGGNDVLDGGGGTNTVSFASAATGVTVSLALQGQAQATGVGTDVLSHFQNLTGSAYNDVLAGDANNNVIDGGGGTNTVSYANATAGVTVSLALQGQAQNTVGAGIDTLSHFQNLTGSAYNDTLAGDANNNVLDGGAGINTVSYAAATAGVTVSLALQGQAQNTVGAGTDTLIHFQNLVGSAYNDTLAGANADVLTGGAGADRFVFAPGGGAETVTDFSHAQGDRIDLTAFAGLHTLSQVLASAGQVGADTVIGLGGGASVTLDNVQLSSLTASDFALSGSKAVSDFNGDGTSDLIWQSATGLVTTWLVDDANVSGLPALGNVPGWQAQDVGNFDGGAYSAEVLLRSTSTGQVVIWQSNGLSASGTTIGQISLDWQIMGTGDFNGDGKSDILWRNETNGLVDIWTMNGTQVASSANLGQVGLNWKIVGVGDFNGDGRSEVLWHDAASGLVDIWTASPAGGASGQVVATLGTEWQVMGAGDFNGDGRSDILWRSAQTGQAVVWEMNGAQVAAAQAIGDPGADWSVAAVGDYNGDGKADIVWRNVHTGQAVLWAMNGFSVDHWGVLSTVDNSWHIVNHHFDVA